MIRREAIQSQGSMLFELAKQTGSLDKVADDLDKIAEMAPDLPKTAGIELTNLVSLLTSSAKVFRELYDSVPRLKLRGSRENR